MSAIVSALDNVTFKRHGENAHVEYGWSHNLKEKIVQFFFQLVRTKGNGMEDLKKNLNDILFRLKGHEDSEEFSLMYRLIGHTRDLVKGKGERDLSYMQLHVWWEHGYHTLAQFALQCMTQLPDDEHQYGSWADIKYFAEYLQKNGEKNHPLVRYACELMVVQIMDDWESYMNKKKNPDAVSKSLSLAARWAPREKSKHGWLCKKMAQMWSEKCATVSSNEFPSAKALSPHTWIQNATTSGNRQQIKKANLKVQIHWNKMLTLMNKEIQTPQIKFCEKDWASLDFNRVTSKTLSKNKLAIRNKMKKGKGLVEREHKSQEAKADREACAQNYQKHIDAAQSGDTTKKIHGKRCSMYELVKSAYQGHDNQTTNMQWESNSTINGKLGDMIACVDTSGSMECDECTPLYTAIGMGIRISEKSNPAFRNRVLTFDSTPQWFQLNDNMTFCEKAKHINHDRWGMNTNFYKMLNMILDVAIQNKLPPGDVNKMILVVLSDMQIDAKWSGNGHDNMNSMYEEITRRYHEAGIQAVGEPYTPPHIAFFNLRKTSGFPVLSTQKNVTMLSGYNPVALNVFCEKGVEALQEFTPYKMFTDILNADRYQIMHRQRDMYLIGRDAF